MSNFKNNEISEQSVFIKNAFDEMLSKLHSSETALKNAIESNFSKSHELDQEREFLKKEHEKYLIQYAKLEEQKVEIRRLIVEQESIAKNNLKEKAALDQRESGVSMAYEEIEKRNSELNRKQDDLYNQQQEIIIGESMLLETKKKLQRDIKVAEIENGRKARLLEEADSVKTNIMGNK